MKLHPFVKGTYKGIGIAGWPACVSPPEGCSHVSMLTLSDNVLEVFLNPLPRGNDSDALRLAFRPLSNLSLS
eukprot:scaffold287452_cov37-Prasinocladus_malaysianus.AAC.1